MASVRRSQGNFVNYRWWLYFNTRDGVWGECADSPGLLPKRLDRRGGRLEERAGADRNRVGGPIQRLE